MKKLTLLFATLFIGFCALGQNTVTLEAGTTGFTPQFRYKAITPDSLNHWWLYNPLTAKYNRIFTGTESGLRYVPYTGAITDFTTKHKVSFESTVTGLTTHSFIDPGDGGYLWLIDEITGDVTEFQGNRIYDFNNGARIPYLKQGEAVPYQNANKKINIPTQVSIGDTTHINRLLYVIGTSISLGPGNGGLTSVDQRYVNKLAVLFGMTPVVNGLSGRFLQQGVTPNGTTGYENRFQVPNYTTGSIYGIELQVNDAGADSTIYTPAIYQSQLNSMVDAAISKGWPTSSIIILNTAYYNSATASSYPHIEERHDQYSVVMQSVATARSTLFYDGYYTFKAAVAIDPTLLVGNLHPSPAGHTLIANAMYAAFNAVIPTYTNTTDTLLKVFSNARTEYNHSVGNNLTVGGTIYGGTADVTGLISRGQTYVGNTISAGYNFLNSLPIASTTTIANGYIGQIQKTVTAPVYYNYASASLADSVILSGVTLYHARMGSIGTGSSAGTPIGFDVNLNLGGSGTTGAKGFASNIANNGSTYFNLYLNGTGFNFLNGAAGFGLSTPTARVDIAGGSTTVTPFRIRSGPVNTTPLAGAVEYTSPDLTFVNSGTSRNFFVFGTAKPTSAQFLVSNGTNYTPVTMSGDAAINSTGVVTLKSSIALAGSPTTTTQATATNNTTIATTAFVKAQGYGTGTGTVTSVTSANTDIAVANTTTTPVLTLNNINGVTKSYYDPASSIQTQLNTKAGLSTSNTFTNSNAFNNSVTFTGNINDFNGGYLTSSFNIGGTGISTISSTAGRTIWANNYTNGGGETDLFTGIGSAGSVGGLNVYGYTNGGSVTQLLYLNGTSKALTTFGRIVPGIIDASVNNANLFAQYDVSTNALVSRTNAQVRADLGLSSTGTPTIVAGPGAGTSPTISIVGNNQDGIITLTVGVTPAVGVIFTVTMGSGFTYPTSCATVITPASAGTAATVGYATLSSLTNSGFSMSTAPALVSATTLTWTYHNGGY